MKATRFRITAVYPDGKPMGTWIVGEKPKRGEEIEIPNDVLGRKTPDGTKVGTLYEVVKIKTRKNTVTVPGVKNENDGAYQAVAVPKEDAEES